MTVANGGKIYGGLEDGFLIMAEDDNNWKITDEIKLDDKVKHIAVDGRWVAIQQGMAPIKLWDEELQGFAENHKELGLGCTEKMWLSYPLIFVAGRQGTRENRRDTFGVEIWNIQTGVMVRHILKEGGEKQYRSMHSNGQLLTFCEEVHGWRDMEEWRKRENVEVAVFDLSQLKDENVKDEELWNFSTTFSVTDMEYEWVVAAISDKNLVVNHDKTKFSH